MKRKPGAAGGKSSRHVTSHDTDGTKSPLPPLTIEEYFEREEVLKLRVVSLKKVQKIASIVSYKIIYNLAKYGGTILKFIILTEGRRNGIRNGEAGTGT